MYPENYRAFEVDAIQSAIRAGECVAVIGLSGAGKSNLMAFLAQKTETGNPRMVLVDCNRLQGDRTEDFLMLVGSCLGRFEPSGDILASLELYLRQQLAAAPKGICLLLDRFEAIHANMLSVLAGNLRWLRDVFKYRLTFVISSRQPLAEDTELGELFTTNTIWLGPLASDDARWSIQQFTSRHKLAWDENMINQIISVSWGYPSMLRSVCEAVAAGVEPVSETLHGHPSVRRRVQEFLSSHPSSEYLQASRLTGHPLLCPPQSAAEGFDPDQLTPAEYRLFSYFRDHPDQVCSKDDLILVVWKEEQFLEGTRDDSLAQLVHRLRRKIDSKQDHSMTIRTVAGRGYLFSKINKS
jgi:hypothetical protein